MVLIERGEAELWLPEADGERFVGLSGPTKDRFVGKFGLGGMCFDDVCGFFFWGERLLKRICVCDISCLSNVALGYRWVRFGRWFMGREAWIEIVGVTLFLVLLGCLNRLSACHSV